MTKWRVLGCVLILLGILGGSKPGAQPAGDGPPGGSAPSAPATAAASDRQAPEIFLVEPEYDAGKVTEGDVVKHTFVVQNRGLGELVIERIKPS